MDINHVKIFEKGLNHLEKYNEKTDLYKIKKNYIIFRGTKHNSEYRKLLTVEPEIHAHNENALIHRGFYNIYNSIRNDLFNQIDLSLPLYIIGFSLGGCLATIFSYELLELHLFNNITVFTIGSPFCVNLYISNVINKNICFYRIENKYDLMPVLFNCYRKYHKPGKLIKIDKPHLSVITVHYLSTYMKYMRDLC
jgi:hypothetical protein